MKGRKSLMWAAIAVMTTLVYSPVAATALKPPVWVWARCEEIPEFGKKGLLVKLEWKASVDPRVIAYNIYRSEKSGTGFQFSGSVLQEQRFQRYFVDRAVQSGTTYYYVVTTVDADRKESEYSTEASVAAKFPQSKSARLPPVPNPKLLIRKSEQVLIIQGGKGFDLGAPGDVVVDSRGNIHVLDALSCTVKSFSPRGEYLGEIGKKGLGTGTITYPAGLGIDLNDTIYVADRGPESRIDIYDVKGRFLREIIAPPPGREILNLARDKSLRPALRDVAVNSRGRIFATDNALSRLLIFEQDGTFVREVGRMGEEPGDLSYPGWLAINDKDEVHVGNGFNQRIEVFDADGTFLRVYGLSKDRIGSFYRGPAGIAFDENGNSIVADALLSTLQEFSANGEYLFSIGNEKAEFDRRYQRPLLSIRMPVGIAYDRGAKSIIFTLNMDKAVMVRRLLE